MVYKSYLLIGDWGTLISSFFSSSISSYVLFVLISSMDMRSFILCCIVSSAFSSLSSIVAFMVEVTLGALFIASNIATSLCICLVVNLLPTSSINLALELSRPREDLTSSSSAWGGFKVESCSSSECGYSTDEKQRYLWSLSLKIILKLMGGYSH